MCIFRQQITCRRLQISPIWTGAVALDGGIFQANWAEYQPFYWDLCSLNRQRIQIDPIWTVAVHRWRPISGQLGRDGVRQGHAPDILICCICTGPYFANFEHSCTRCILCILCILCKLCTLMHTLHSLHTHAQFVEFINWCTLCTLLHRLHILHTFRDLHAFQTFYFALSSDLNRYVWAVCGYLNFIKSFLFIFLRMVLLPPDRGWPPNVSQGFVLITLGRDALASGMKTIFPFPRDALSGLIIFYSFESWYGPF